jgi:hypothetical protein
MNPRANLRARRIAARGSRGRVMHTAELFSISPHVDDRFACGVSAAHCKSLTMQEQMPWRKIEQFDDVTILQRCASAGRSLIHTLIHKFCG